MKIRSGFVSNSSSSSFVLGKAYLTDEQVKEFSHALGDINDDNHGEGYLFETKYYFHGDVSMHNEYIEKLIDKMGIMEYCSFEC